MSSPSSDIAFTPAVKSLQTLKGSRVNRQRIKSWGRADAIEGNEELNDRFRDPQYAGKVERSVLFHVEAWDVNCSQHIHPRLPAAIVEPAIAAMQKKISDLQEEI